MRAQILPGVYQTATIRWLVFGSAPGSRAQRTPLLVVGTATRVQIQYTMAPMSSVELDRQPRSRRPWAAIIVIAITAAACLVALGFRTSIRSRYWAWCLARAANPTERSAHLSALCNAGDAGRWGTGALLRHEDAEVRQYGVLALHHVRSDWARERLLERLTDPDSSVQRLAAVGLAIHGDDGVIPELRRLYRTGDVSAASTACAALEYLATPAAIAAANELAAEPADAARRAALVDTLDAIGEPECVPALISLLSDHRVCDVPLRRDETARRVLSGLLAEGYPLVSSSMPTTAASPRTIAERAAAALARITGQDVPFASDATEEERSAAERQWADWHATRQGGN